MARLRFPKIKYFFLGFFILCSLILYDGFKWFNYKLDASISSNSRITTKNATKPSRIVIAIEVNLEESELFFNAIKSILLFTKTPVYFVVFIENTIMNPLKGRLRKWRAKTTYSFHYEFKKVDNEHIEFPNAVYYKWGSINKKYATQRLFVPNILTHIDSLIYIDVDVIFLGPVEDLWSEFNNFNETQISALASEVKNPSLSWYSKFSNHPYYGKYGVNSGVMLMNLTRMRKFGWEDLQTSILQKWINYVTIGDQDIINIIFHYFPQTLYEMSCRLNYRTDHCLYGDTCKEAHEKGILAIHGNRNAFSETSSLFKVVYDVISTHKVGDDPKILVSNLIVNAKNGSTLWCKDFTEAIIKIPIAFLKIEIKEQKSLNKTERRETVK